MEIDPTHRDEIIIVSSSSSSPTSPQCCWLCLEEGPDSSGRPLVRDCSCRGSSGYAHLSCLIQYAESDARSSYTSIGNIGKAFQECPNCKQEFQNDLRYNLERARLAFVEREFATEDRMLYLRALIHRVRVLDARDERDRVEGDGICVKMMKIVDEMKRKIGDGRQQGDAEFTKLEAVVLYVIGLFHMNVGTEETLQEALEYFGGAIYLFTLLGDEINLTSANRNVSKIESMFNGDEDEDDRGNDLEYSQRQYSYWLGKLGEDNPITIRRGELLAHALYVSNQGVAAERLLMKLATTSRQVHGPGHNCTLSVTSALNDVKERRVYIESRRLWFQALQYEHDGLSCVVRGPMPSSPGGTSSGYEEGTMSTLSFPVTDVLPGPGTPVVCQGLVDKAHLNGKIGDTRGFNEGKFEVHFEEAGLEPAIVDRGNLRIVFDLP